MTNIPDIFGQYFGPVQDKLDKLPKEIAAEADIMLYERARTVKHMELPQILLGTAASNVLAIGEVSGIVLGPRQGYAWAVRRLVVDGLTSGSTPDVVNLYKHGFPSSDLAPTIPPAWQFNGNNFGYTFGKGELTLLYAVN